MKKINIFSTGTYSRSKNVTAQWRQNVYLEVGGDKSPADFYGMPGLTLFSSFEGSPIRGIHSLFEYIYVVKENGLYKVNASGTISRLGSLNTGGGRVSMANNGLQIIIVDGAYGYIYTLATGVFQNITDGDFPGADTVTFNDSYFIVNKPNTGQFYISGSYNGLTWNALNFATAESTPDNLIAVFADHGTLLLLTSLSIEFWAATGGADFPYSRMTSSTIQWGLAARWSIAQFNNSIIFLGLSRMGEVQVVQLQGNAPVRVSTSDIEAIFKNYSNINETTGFSYMFNGHAFYQLNFLDGASWLYDGTSGCWSAVKSFNMSRHRSEMSCVYLGNIYMTDYSSGHIYKLDQSVYTENGEAIEIQFTSKHLSNNLDRLSISQLQLELEPGVGLAIGQGNNPQISLQVSKDGGHTWGPERFANIGMMGNYVARAKWTRLGQARDWVFKFMITDPIKVVILGAYIEGQ